jgi:hypothetical protein
MESVVRLTATVVDDFCSFSKAAFDTARLAHARATNADNSRTGGTRSVEKRVETLGLQASIARPSKYSGS